MYSDNEKTALIDKVLLGTASPEETIIIEKLKQEDAAFAEELAFQMDFIGSLEVVGNQDLKVHFQELEADIQTAQARSEQVGSVKAKLNQVKEQINYTIDQLVAMFRPVNNYQMVMGYTDRSGGLSVIHPENELDCQSGILSFELEAPASNTIQFTIENNQQEIVLTKEVAANEAYFMITLPEGLTPGIYYWKLSHKEELVMGNFYVQKELMPA